MAWSHAGTGASVQPLLLGAITTPYLTARIMRLHREQILSCRHNEIWAPCLTSWGREHGHGHIPTHTHVVFLSAPPRISAWHSGEIAFRLSVWMTETLPPLPLRPCAPIFMFSNNPAATSDRLFDLWLQFPCADTKTQATLPTLQYVCILVSPLSWLHFPLPIFSSVFITHANLACGYWLS